MTQEKYAELVKLADSIPSMGGRQIRQHIYKYVDMLKPGQAVVELGTWLGATTASIALALSIAEMNNPIYSYDRFIVKGRQPEKAGNEGWWLYEGQDVLPRVKSVFSYFPVLIEFIKGNILDIKYSGEKIGLYIDDAAKAKKNFDHALKTFAPYFIPGETICFFMDYYLWQKTGEEDHKYQYNFMQAHKENFQHIEDIDTSYQGVKETGAIFRYMGGL